MKIKIILCSMLVIVMAHTAKSQHDGFKLSSYTPPAYSYKSLDLYYDLSGYAIRQTTHLDDVLTQKNIVNYFSTSITPKYYSYSNSDKYQGSTSLLLYAGISANKNDPNAVNKDSHTQGGNSVKLYYDGTNRFYFSNLRFLEIDPVVRLVTQTTKYTDKDYQYDTLVSDNSTKLWNPYITASVPIFHGYGRIDDVTDARHALYILDGLQQSGRLSRETGSDDILKLAAGITKIKNKRFFDSRQRRIAELVTLDSVLQATGLKGESDAVYFAILNDEWVNSGNIRRNSGFRLYGGILPELQFNHSLNKTDLKLAPELNSKSWDNTSVGYIGLEAGFISEKPLSLKWQSTISASAGYGIEQNLIKDKILLPDPVGPRVWKSNQQRGTLSASYGLGYYPDSRTWLKAGISTYDYYYGKGTDKPYAGDEKDMNPSLNLSLGPDVSAYFYFSPQLRLEFSGRMYYSYNWTENANVMINHTKTNGWNLYLNSRLTYSLF